MSRSGHPKLVWLRVTGPWYEGVPAPTGCALGELKPVPSRPMDQIPGLTQGRSFPIASQSQLVRYRTQFSRRNGTEQRKTSCYVGRRVTVIRSGEYQRQTASRASFLKYSRHLAAMPITIPNKDEPPAAQLGRPEAQIACYACGPINQADCPSPGVPRVRLPGWCRACRISGAARLS